MFSRIAAAIRNWLVQFRCMAKPARYAMDILRQYPWIVPAGVISSAAAWIEQQRIKRGWYDSQRSDWYQEIYPSTLFSFTPPANNPATMQWFRGDLFRSSPAAGVYCFRGAYVYSDQGAVISRDNRIFTEFTHHFGTASIRSGPCFKPFATLQLDIPRQKEWVALMAAPECRNYYHWLFDVMPRFHLLKRFSEQIELYAVPSNLTPVQMQTIEYAGIDKSRLLFLPENRKIYFERLLVPSLPGSEGAIPEWALNYLRTDLIMSLPAPVKKRKLYLSRMDAKQRQVVNEPDVIRFLTERGFEHVVPGSMSFAEQVNMFREATMVIGCHGAGFSNLVFADRCKVLEIFSPEYVRPDCYFTLSQQLGHDYRYLIGQKSTTGWGDIHISLETLAGMIDQWD